MQTIWKYELLSWLQGSSGAGLGKVETGALPEGSRLLSVGLDPGQNVCAWFLVDTDAPAGAPANFYITGTGQPVDLGPKHFTAPSFQGSVVQGTFVWHIFRF